MNLNRKNIRKIRGLIVFTALVILALMKFDLLWNGAFFVVGILRPFLVGGMIAFVINLPMKFYETRLFKNGNLQGKAGKALNRCSRGLSLLLAILSVVLAITLLAVTVIPQLASTIKDLANKIPAFWNDVIMKLEVVLAADPELHRILADFQSFDNRTE
ncbi:MAG: AI-2E family transporter, partial [Lachnospiraceae bacterium]|nr:AI-2E family transporter [Lachnospiraceae bacterium]